MLERELSIRRGARERDVLVKTTPLRGGYVVVLRDVTESKEVDRMKRDFLSVVTHELKTPLTAIEGYTKLLEMGKGGGLSDKQKEFVKTVAEQTAKLKEMIQDLLDVTRLESGKLPLSITHLRAKEALEDARRAFHGQAEARGVELELDAERVGNAQVAADPFRLHQVLGNLVGNAFKFTERGGRVRLVGERDGGTVLLSVEDTGRGIPEDSIPRLFGKFYQVQRGDTRVAGGAGLGLYICRQLVEAQGGTIEVRSKVGEGTRFTMRFADVGSVLAPAEEG